MIEIPTELKDILVERDGIIERIEGQPLITKNQGTEFIYILKCFFGNINKDHWLIETNLDYIDGETECICKHDIKYLYYITHIPTCTTFKVGSICVQKVSEVLYAKAIKMKSDRERLQNGNSVCKNCNIVLRKGTKNYLNEDREITYLCKDCFNNISKCVRCDTVEVKEYSSGKYKFNSCKKCLDGLIASKCKKCDNVKNTMIYFVNKEHRNFEDAYYLCSYCSNILKVGEWTCYKNKYKNTKYKDVVKIDPEYCIFLVENGYVNDKITEYILLILDLDIEK